MSLSEVIIALQRDLDLTMINSCSLVSVLISIILYMKEISCLCACCACFVLPQYGRTDVNKNTKTFIKQLVDLLVILDLRHSGRVVQQTFPVARIPVCLFVCFACVVLISGGFYCTGLCCTGRLQGMLCHTPP